MTDDTKVPPWLVFKCHEEETGKTYYVPAKPAEKELCHAVHGSVSWKTLRAWLAWREKVAAALGLVDLEQAIDRITAVRDLAARHWVEALRATQGIAFPPSVEAHLAALRESIERDRKACVNAAIAAELRRLADDFASEQRYEGVADSIIAAAREDTSLPGDPYRPIDIAKLLRARADELDPR